MDHYDATRNLIDHYEGMQCSTIARNLIADLLQIGEVGAFEDLGKILQKYGKEES